MRCEQNHVLNSSHPHHFFNLHVTVGSLQNIGEYGAVCGTVNITCFLSIQLHCNVWDFSLQWMCQTKIFLHHSGWKKWNLIEKVQWWQIGWEQLRGISSDASTPRLWQTLINIYTINYNCTIFATWKYLWKDYHVIYGMPHPYCTTFSPGLAATHL